MLQSAWYALEHCFAILLAISGDRAPSCAVDDGKLSIVLNQNGYGYMLRSGELQVNWCSVATKEDI